MNMENKRPKVSVIVTTYNREKYLKETIQSILNQTFTDFELIVVDNFSNYNFFEIIESFNDSRIKAFQNQNNGIIAINRNFGLKNATGEYVAFCDDDDTWATQKLEKQIEVIKEHDKLIVCSNVIYIDKESCFIKTIRKKSYKNPFQIYVNNIITLSSVLVNNTDLLVFDESSLFKAIEDCGLWTKLIHNGYNVFNMNEPLVNYRITGANFSFNKRFEPVRRIALFSAMLLRYQNVPLRYYIKGVLRDISFFIYYSLTKR